MAVHHGTHAGGNSRPTAAFWLHWLGFSDGHELHAMKLCDCRRAPVDAPNSKSSETLLMLHQVFLAVGIGDQVRADKEQKAHQLSLKFFREKAEQVSSIYAEVPLAGSYAICQF